MRGPLCTSISFYRYNHIYLRSALLLSHKTYTLHCHWCVCTAVADFCFVPSRTVRIRSCDKYSRNYDVFLSKLKVTALCCFSWCLLHCCAFFSSSDSTCRVWSLNPHKQPADTPEDALESGTVRQNTKELVANSSSAASHDDADTVVKASPVPVTSEAMFVLQHEDSVNMAKIYFEDLFTCSNDKTARRWDLVGVRIPLLAVTLWCQVVLYSAVCFSICCASSLCGSNIRKCSVMRFNYGYLGARKMRYAKSMK